MKIGITFTGADEKQQFYHDWLNAASSDHEFVTLHPGDGVPDITGFGGLVFSGGIDIDPSLYNASASYANAPAAFNTVRDSFEKDLYHAAVAHHLPILGICRGMQFINVLHGGSLRQDLGHDGNAIHRAVPADKKHNAAVKQDTMLMQLFLDHEANAEQSDESDAITFEINSAHHQVIDRLGTGLTISCYSEDGVPEAMEKMNTDGSFLLCVQWHPERMFRFGLENTPPSAAVRESFLAAINKHAMHHENY
jgi:putative glutamine amidotransferase